MIPAIDVARYLIHLAAPAEDENADCLSNMRLQKLLYYVQGWHLAAFGQPLFEGRIEAWQHGPVVREVYAEFKQYGSSTIPLTEGGESPTLSERDKLFISRIWEHYRQYSATALRNMTHNERPWIDTWAASGSNQRGGMEIPQSGLRDFFAPKARTILLRSDSRLDRVMLDRTQADIHAGRVHTAQEIRCDLHHRHSDRDA